MHLSNIETFIILIPPICKSHMYYPMRADLSRIAEELNAVILTF